MFESCRLVYSIGQKEMSTIASDTSPQSYQPTSRSSHATTPFCSTAAASFIFPHSRDRRSPYAQIPKGALLRRASMAPHAPIEPLTRLWGAQITFSNV